ncbi:MAG: hypothetical protein IH899_16615 [Planctomycetes bacterium]|nr:hypothetical protein [Planctomycetota bacterium]
MPQFEEFVFAAVYFRQLFMTRNDYLLTDAADRYCGHVDCPIRQSWIAKEIESFNGILDSPTFPFNINDYTLRQIFDAFMYGAGLMHKIPDVNDATLRRFLDICDNFPRARLLYAMNMQLMVLMNHVGNVATIIHQDFAHWQSEYSLPLPDIRWHDGLFTARIDG